MRGIKTGSAGNQQLTHGQKKAVATIIAWNRVGTAFRSEAGTYKPAAHG